MTLLTAGNMHFLYQALEDAMKSVGRCMGSGLERGRSISLAVSELFLIVALILQYWLCAPVHNV